MDRLVSVVLACALSACSLSITAPAANRKRNQMPECDSSKGLVAVDSLAAIAFGVGGLAALSEDQGTGAVALVGAALFTAAALHGSSNADKCRVAMAEYSREIAVAAPSLERPRRATRRPADPDPDDDPEPGDPEPPRTARRSTPAVPAGPDPEPVPDPKPEPKPEPKLEPKPAPKPAPAPEPPRGVRDWSQFWREVP